MASSGGIPKDSGANVGCLDLSLSHGVGVDAKRHGWIGVPQALRSVHRVLACSNQFGCMEVSQRVQVNLWHLKLIGNLRHVA